MVDKIVEGLKQAQEKKKKEIGEILDRCAKMARKIKAKRASFGSSGEIPSFEAKQTYRAEIEKMVEEYRQIKQELPRKMAHVSSDREYAASVHSYLAELDEVVGG